MLSKTKYDKQSDRFLRDTPSSREWNITHLRGSTASTDSTWGFHIYLPKVVWLRLLEPVFFMLAYFLLCYSYPVRRSFIYFPLRSCNGFGFFCLTVCDHILCTRYLSRTNYPDGVLMMSLGRNNHWMRIHTYCSASGPTLRVLNPYTFLWAGNHWRCTADSGRYVRGPHRGQRNTSRSPPTLPITFQRDF